MNRMSYETQNFDGYFSHFTIYHFGLSWLLARLSTKKLLFTIISWFKQLKLSATIMSNLNMSKLNGS